MPANAGPSAPASHSLRTGNIAAASENRTIWLDTPFGRLPFTYEDTPESGVGVSVWSGGDYEHPLGERWRLRTGADLSQREHKGSAFDRTTLAAHAGPRRLIDRNTEASLLATAAQHWLAGAPQYRDLGLRLEADRRLGPRLTASLRASWLHRRYDDSSDLDGPAADLSLGASYLLTPTLRAELSLGGSRARPERLNQRNTGRRAEAGLTAALPWGFTLGGSAALNWTDYKGNWYPFTTEGRPRKDQTRSVRLSAHHRAFTLWGFSPRLSLVRENRTSNAQLHDYERTYGELSFIRLF